MTAVLSVIVGANDCGDDGEDVDKDSETGATDGGESGEDVDKDSETAEMQH